VPQSGNKKPVFFVIAAVVVILFIVGLIGGAIGQALDIGSPDFLHVPILEIHEFFKGDALFHVSGFAVTNTLIASWFTIIVVVAIGFAATRKMRIVPKRLQGIIEVALEALMNFVISVAGEKNGRRFFPVIATIFIFVMFNAYFALMPFFGPGITVEEKEYVHFEEVGIIESIGLHFEEDEHSVKVEEDGEDSTVIMVLEGGYKVVAPMSGHIEEEHLEHYQVGDHVEEGESEIAIISKPPLFRSANTDINMTLALAIMAVFAIEFWGWRSKGFRHYIEEYLNFGELSKGTKMLFTGKLKDAPMVILTGVINVFMGFIEMLSHAIRMVSFAFRLFGNMTAGEILLLSATFLVPWIMAIPFYGLELLIGFIQALIFGGLTLVWATMAVEHASEEH